MRFLPGNAQHIGSRQSQQDSFGFADPDDEVFISHGGFLAIVCDGMGGMEHGDAASRTAVRTFLDAYGRKTPQESIPAALERSVFEANASVVELARRFGMVEGIGTTLVATALMDRVLFYISVGDSGIFHVSGGQMQTVNRPHVFANMLDQAVARGQITREAALAHPERESLTSYIGAEKLDEIDRNIDPWPLQDGDTVLLASDGMFKTLEPGEILTSLRGNPPSWPETLVEQTLAKQREFQDNVTVLSVTFESETRAAGPRTVLMAPPPPAVAGVPVDSKPEIPRTIMLPMSPGVTVGPAAPLPIAMLPLTEPPIPLSPPPAAPFPMAQPPLATQPPGLPPTAWAPEPVPAVAAPWQPPPLGIPPTPRRSPALMLVILVVLAAVGVGGWWYWTHRPAADRTGQSDPGFPTKSPKRDPNQPIPLPKPTEVQPVTPATPDKENRK